MMPQGSSTAAARCPYSGKVTFIIKLMIARLRYARGTTLSAMVPVVWTASGEE
jgi:hypothetical protein